MPTWPLLGWGLVSNTLERRLFVSLSVRPYVRHLLVLQCNIGFTVTTAVVSAISVHVFIILSHALSLLSGPYYLVLMVDPLHSAVTEPRRCDNHVAFQMNFECPNMTTQAGVFATCKILSVICLWFFFHTDSMFDGVLTFAMYIRTSVLKVQQMSI